MSKFIKVSLLLMFIMTCGTVTVAIGSFLYLSPALPAPAKLKDVQFQTPLRIYSEDGLLMSEFGEMRRIPLSYENIPPTLIDAILAAEDDQFFQHSGVSAKGLARATYELISTGSIQSGGSTVTMQVAKNFFLTRERSFLRKFNEILLALKIEKELSKEEIITLYINKIYLGHRAYGFGAAAKVYYGKDLYELDLAQTATLAGLPKAPSTANPITNPERALIRRNWIIGRMFQLGKISASVHELAINTPQSASFHGLRSEVEADYAAEMVREEMVQRYGDAAYRDGFVVTTTINSKLQNVASSAVRNGLLDYDKRHGYRGPLVNISEKLGTDADAKTNFTSIDTNKIDFNLYQGSGLIEPALVLNLGEDTAILLTSNNETIVIDFDGLAWAKAYIDANTLGQAPLAPADILTVGDIVYVTRNSSNERWELSQIPEAQSALISLNPTNGAILSIIGGFDFSLSKYNRATQAQRQAGSNIKPFIYAAALSKGYTPASIINDAPVVFNDPNLEKAWRPENSSGRFFGPTRLRQALYKSRNLVSVRILQNIGIAYAINYSTRFGFTKEQLPYDLSLALGSAGITPLQMAKAYAILANGGYKIEPFIIQSINSDRGEELFKAMPYTVCPDCEDKDQNAMSRSNEFSDQDTLESEDALQITGVNESERLTDVQTRQFKIAPRIMDDRINYLINSIMRDVIQKGTGYGARKMKRNDIAGKTGTTNDQNDAWFSGYSPDIVTSVWVGFDQPQTLGRKEFGSRAALPIWIDYMTVALEGKSESFMQQPEGLITIRINPDTGEATRPGDRSAIFEIFRTENAPSTPKENRASPVTINPERDETLQLF